LRPGRAGPIWYLRPRRGMAHLHRRVPLPNEERPVRRPPGGRDGSKRTIVRGPAHFRAAENHDLGPRCRGDRLSPRSIPFGLVLTRFARLGDIPPDGRQYARPMSCAPQQDDRRLTLLFDVVKGAAAALIGAAWSVEAALAGGAAVVIGHMFPVWLGFRGGKGVATALRGAPRSGLEGGAARRHRLARDGGDLSLFLASPRWSRDRCRGAWPVLVDRRAPGLIAMIAVLVHPALTMRISGGCWPAPRAGILLRKRLRIPAARHLNRRNASTGCAEPERERRAGSPSTPSCAVSGSAERASTRLPRLVQSQGGPSVTAMSRRDAEAELARSTRLGGRVSAGRAAPIRAPSPRSRMPRRCDCARPPEMLPGSSSPPIVAVVGARNGFGHGRASRAGLAANGRSGIVVVSGLRPRDRRGGASGGSQGLGRGRRRRRRHRLSGGNRDLHNALARDGAILAGNAARHRPPARHFRGATASSRESRSASWWSRRRRNRAR